MREGGGWKKIHNINVSRSDRRRMFVLRNEIRRREQHPDVVEGGYEDR